MPDSAAEMARKLVEIRFPGKKAKEVAEYKGNLLVRVEHEDPDEQNWDPFVLVDISAQTVEDFSILHDGKPAEVMAAFQNPL